MRISIIKKIKNFINRKERFLHACIYSFYVQKARVDLDGIGFLPFINEQHNRDWARMKANELIAQFKKEGTISIRYKHALAWAKACK
ncbi:hypothetical protein IJ425_04125 [bacterium]|nr:hypothetical protein [bacterium]